MKTLQVGLAALLAVASCGLAYAIEPSHTGPYGNPEEPATRPYKAMWRGLKALKYQTCKGVKDGNNKVEYVGSIEGFRGVRRGVVELGHSTYWGMAGTYPPPVDAVSPWNKRIDQDRRLAAFADIPTTVGIIGLAGGGAVGMVFGTGAITVGQSELDRSAMTPEQNEAVLAAARETAKQQWHPPQAGGNRNEMRPEGLRYDRSTVKEPKKHDMKGGRNIKGNPYSGNMIKKARDGSIAE
ncbi:MAG: hypothetical protein K1Y02_15700 [Candidatus Hydrogenedentes bacterium]|nr:hypothetical protein [Candidatus Hydrogenedentota bacterium]